MTRVAAPPCTRCTEEHPPLVVWHWVGTGEMVGHAVAREDEAVDLILGEIDERAELRGPLPHIVRVGDAEVAAEIAECLEEANLDIAVEVAEPSQPTGAERERLLRELSQDGRHTVGEVGLTNDELRQVYAVASEYQRLEPWVACSEDQLLQMAVTVGGTTANYVACISGAESGVRGLDIFDSLESHAAFFEVGDDGDEDDDEAEEPDLPRFSGWHLGIELEEAAEATPAERHELELFGAGLVAWSTVLRIDRYDGTAGRVEIGRADVALATAALAAVRRFVEAEEALFAADDPAPVVRDYEVEVLGEAARVVITAPYPETEWLALPPDDDLEGDEDDDEDDEDDEDDGEEDPAARRRRFTVLSALMEDRKSAPASGELEIACRALLTLGNARSAAAFHLDGEYIDMLLFEEEMLGAVVKPMAAAARGSLVDGLADFVERLQAAGALSWSESREVTRRLELVRARFLAAAPGKATPGRFTPRAGEPPPAPTVPCPCGSGRRYKKCCMPR